MILRTLLVPWFHTEIPIYRFLRMEESQAEGVRKRRLLLYSMVLLGIHSSTLAWKIPWTEEPDRLQSTGSQRVGHDWTTVAQGEMVLLLLAGVRSFLLVNARWQQYHKMARWDAHLGHYRKKKSQISKLWPRALVSHGSVPRSLATEQIK